MNSSEKRKFKRLPIMLDLSCRKVGTETEELYKGYTVNVSPGGVYFETTEDSFEAGNLLKVELSIPPTVGLLELGGRISGFGRVLRTDVEMQSDKYGVAMEFCRSPKLCI